MFLKKTEMAGLGPLKTWFVRNLSCSTIESTKTLFHRWCVTHGAASDTPRRARNRRSPYGYYRELVHKEAPYFEIWKLHWPAHAYAPLHDHPNRGCVQVVLQGTLQEDQLVSGDSGADFFKRRTLNEGQLAFTQARHKMFNPSSSVEAVTMHLYAPSGHETKF